MDINASNIQFSGNWNLDFYRECNIIHSINNQNIKTGY